MRNLGPIETRYHGYRFRSRLEARWAVFFDALRVRWIYEPEGYRLMDGSCYLPDFFLPEFDSHQGTFVEVKPELQMCEKARAFASEMNKTTLLALGMPHAGPFECYDSMDEGGHWGTVAFNAKYLPGGTHADEYRLYWCPEDAEYPDYWEVDHAVMAARAARFEFGEHAC